MNHVEIMARALHASNVGWNDLRWDDLPEGRRRAFLKTAQAALDALKEAGLVQEWQPIETAPTDCVVYAYGNIPGSYGYTEDRFDAVKARKTKEGRWVFAQPMSRYDPVYWSPTYWMPLPAPPEAAESE